MFSFENCTAEAVIWVKRTLSMLVFALTLAALGAAALGLIGSGQPNGAPLGWARAILRRQASATAPAMPPKPPLDEVSVKMHGVAPTRKVESKRQAEEVGGKRALRFEAMSRALSLAVKSLIAKFGY